MKKTISRILAMVLAVLMLSCGVLAQENKPIRVGVLLTDFADKTPSYVRTGFVIHGETTFPGEFDLSYWNAALDADKQIQQTNDLLTTGVDAICIYAVNGATCEPITMACQEAGIPLITICKQIANQQDVSAHVGASEQATGEAQARKVVELMGGKGNVVIVKGRLGSDNTENRTIGYYNVLNEYPEINVVAVDTATWSREDAMILIENWAQSGLAFDAVLANNDEMAIGAALALQGMGVDLNDYIISGIDGTPDCLELMKDNLVDVTVYINPLLMAKEALQLLKDYYRDGTETSDCWIEPLVVTPENVDTFIAEWDTVLSNLVTE